MEVTELFAWIVVIAFFALIAVPVFILWLADGVQAMGYWEAVVKGNVTLLLLFAIVLCAALIMWAFDTLFAS